MWGRTVHFIAAVLVASFVIACDATKSSNPLSPSVAGPMPGVAITTPKPLEPNNGWELDNNTQPVRLMLENSSSSGPRPVTYIFEVASDAGFANLVFSRGGVAPGDEGRTTIQMSDRLPTGVPFFWRAKAEDGANVSAYSAPVSFSVVTPVIIDMPVPLSPVGATEIETNQPTFHIRNPARSGPAGALVYQLQVGPHEAFAISNCRVSDRGAARRDAVRRAPAVAVQPAVLLARAVFRHGSSGVVGPWSAAQPFRTGTAPAGRESWRGWGLHQAIPARRTRRSGSFSAGAASTGTWAEAKLWRSFAASQGISTRLGLLAGHSGSLQKSHWQPMRWLFV